MEVDWKVDPELNRLGWKALNDVPGEVSARSEKCDLIIDIGGGSGGFGNLARSSHPKARVICIDLEPRVVDNGVEHIEGSGLDLPFKDSSADLITVHAMLHHVPNELDKAMKEVYRVLRPGGFLIIQEPLDKNPFANMVRKRITTTHHDEGERPLPFKDLEAVVERYFKTERIDHHFITFYLMPHIVPRMPGPLKGITRALSRVAFRMDNRLLSSSQKSRKWAAYVNIISKKL